MLIDLQTIITQLPNYAFWKDTRCIFRGCNAEFARIAGLTSIQDVDGKSDFELPWRHTHADYYRQKDQEVLAGKNIINGMETQLQASGKIVQVLVNKSIFCNDKGKVIGIICQYSQLPDTVSISPTLSLSPKQQFVLKYLSKGFSAKRIANLLHMSVRTVEAYTEVLKRKFQCHTKYELVIKANQYVNLQTG